MFMQIRGIFLSNEPIKEVCKVKKDTVIVTGGARGIGAEISKTLALNGYNVIINYNKSQDEAMQIKNNLINKGFNVEIFKADVSNILEVENMINFCKEKYATVDVLVNNAGISQAKLFTDITQNDLDNIINVNLKGTFYCSQFAAREMIRRKKGKIINISSMWGMVGASCEVHYSAAKAGVIGLTKALAKELAPSNIQVNCVSPGVIETDMISDLCESEIESLKQQTPLLRLGKTGDIANLIFFLASNKADFITGQVISSNGGFVI